MQTSSSVVVETSTPWHSMIFVATINGISAPNFTMNATKFHITMPRKLASAALHSVALCAMQYFSCASLPCYSKALLTTQAQSLQFPCDWVAQQCLINSIMHERSQSWEIKNAEIRGNAEVSHACITRWNAREIGIFAISTDVFEYWAEFFFLIKNKKDLGSGPFFRHRWGRSPINFFLCGLITFILNCVFLSYTGVHIHVYIHINTQ